MAKLVRRNRVDRALAPKPLSRLNLATTFRELQIWASEALRVLKERSG